MYKKIVLLACIISVSLAGSVFGTRANTYTSWNGPEGGDWNTATNWSAGVPVTNDTPGVLADPYGRAGFKAATNTSPAIVGTVSTDMVTIGGATAGKLTIASGGTVNISESVTLGTASTEKGTLTMNGGTLNCGVMVASEGKLFVGVLGNSVLVMNSGTINLTSDLSIAHTSGTGYVHLDSGTINAANLLMNAAGAHLDIRGGTLILNGDKTAAIDGFVSSNKIKAYDGAGTVQRDYNVTNAGKTTVTGFLPSPKAINPTPFNSATNIAVTASLSWTAGMGAISHNVYLDTVTPPAAFQGNQTATTFVPSVLAPATTYYWQIDEVDGANVVTTGDIWSFTTISGQPINPSPADASQNIAIHPILSWTGGQGASSHDVYFSATYPPVSFQGNQAGTTFDPGNLLPNTTYYWQIKEVYATATITGPIWSFATPNTKAKMTVTQYCPPQGITGMPINGIILTWTAGVGAVSHDVYLGSTSPGTFQGNQPGTSFAIPTVLTPNTKYYWRIDEKDGSGGTTVGDVNDFTTGDPVVISPYLTWRNDPTNSIMVNWWNPAATGDSSVDYGLTDSYGSTVNLPALVNYHHVELTGLATGTLYHYRIRSSDGTTGSDSTFKTAPDPNTESFKFAFSGDPRGTTTEDEPYYTRQKALCDWVLARDYDFAIEGGDTVWAGASLKAIGKWWPDFFELQGNLSKSKVVMHALGNHEVQEGSYYYWNDFYVDAHPTNGPVGSVGGGRAYSFDYGTAHFVSLATYQVNLDEQKTWLIADLTAAKARGAKWIFVYLHAPMFTSSGHTNRTDCIQKWGPVFDQFGVNVVFQSHNHLYERFKPLVTYYDDVTNPASPVWTGRVVSDGEGVIYTTNGLGGAEFNNGNSADPKLFCWFGTANLNATVVTSVTVSGDIATIEAIRNDTGAVIDTYTITPRMRKDDYNKDGITDMKDLGIFVGSWLDTGMWP